MSDKFCRQCGSPIKSTDAFCSSCGTPTGNTNPADKQTTVLTVTDTAQNVNNEKTTVLDFKHTNNNSDLVFNTDSNQINSQETTVINSEDINQRPSISNTTNISNSAEINADENNQNKTTMLNDKSPCEINVQQTTVIDSKEINTESTAAKTTVINTKSRSLDKSYSTNAQETPILQADTKETKILSSIETMVETANDTTAAIPKEDLDIPTEEADLSGLDILVSEIITEPIKNEDDLSGLDTFTHPEFEVETTIDFLSKEGALKAQHNAESLDNTEQRAKNQTQVINTGGKTAIFQKPQIQDDIIRNIESQGSNSRVYSTENEAKNNPLKRRKTIKRVALILVLIAVVFLAGYHWNEIVSTFTNLINNLVGNLKK